MSWLQMSPPQRVHFLPAAWLEDGKESQPPNVDEEASLAAAAVVAVVVDVVLDAAWVWTKKRLPLLIQGWMNVT